MAKLEARQGFWAFLQGEPDPSGPKARCGIGVTEFDGASIMP